MTNIKIQDDSGDKKFFTIIPNYIINHSSAIDRSLYLEMKRFAGEDGKCFATEKTMMNRLKIGKKQYNKSLEYLINKKWIDFVGTSKGKTRPIKTYKVNNIWQENIDYYKKISAESNLSLGEISAESNRDKSPGQHKISAESNVEEEQRKEKPIKKNITNFICEDDIKLANLLKDLITNNTPTFKQPNINSWSEEVNKIHRLDKRTYEQIEYVIKWSQQDSFWQANILSPAKLRKQFDTLVAQIKRKHNNNLTIAI